MAAAFAINTVNTYASGWRNWERWATKHNAPCFPASPEDLQKWLMALAIEGKQPSTIRTYRSAVAHYHRDHLGDNPAEHPEVRQLVSGIDRQAVDAGYEPSQAEPLRWNHVLQIIQHAEKQLARADMGLRDRQRILADIAMIAVSHDAALRCSELLALRWSDISRSDGAETGRILIRRSKTDQTARGAVCPISAYTLQALERMRPPNAQPHHHIFPISANTVRRRLKAAAQAAGIDPTGISTHSPRIGMAQDLFASGADMAALMIAGRWKQSTTVARYIRHLAADHTPAARYLQIQDRISDKPNLLRILGENFSQLHALAARIFPRAKRTTQKALSSANVRFPRLAESLLQVGQ